MIKIAICDGDNEFISKLEQKILRFAKNENVKIEMDGYMGGEELIQALRKNNRYDLLFLDIELGDSNGIAVGNWIRSRIQYESMQIIFVSEKENYAMQLFDLRPMNFFVKPIKQERVNYILEEYRRLYDFQTHYLEFGKGKHRIRIEERSILYLQSIAKKVQIVTNDQTFGFYAKLSDVMLSLNPYVFCTVHKSYVVNLRYIVSFKKNIIHMVNGDNIPVSRSMKKNLDQALIKRKDNI